MMKNGMISAPIVTPGSIGSNQYKLSSMISDSIYTIESPFFEKATEETPELGHLKVKSIAEVDIALEETAIK